jgi:hypothetical protein
MRQEVGRFTNNAVITGLQKRGCGIIHLTSRSNWNCFSAFPKTSSHRKLSRIKYSSASQITNAYQHFSRSSIFNKQLTTMSDHAARHVYSANGFMQRSFVTSAWTYGQWSIHKTERHLFNGVCGSNKIPR